MGGTKVAAMPKAGTVKAPPVKQTFTRPATGSTAAAAAKKPSAGGNTSAAATA